jgi:hypothetical protein
MANRLLDEMVLVHHFKASWHTAHQRYVDNLGRQVCALLGKHWGDIVMKPLHWEVGLRERLHQYGVKKTCLIYWQKINKKN